MEFWQRVHWYTTLNCNQRCRFCFKPDFCSDFLDVDVDRLTQELIDNDVREVILTGGEPLLFEGLDFALEKLNNAGIDTSIHTNATLLTPDRLGNLSGWADEIAIPIDSMDRETQAYLRRGDCLPQVKKVLKQLQDLEVRIGIHTVATTLNIGDIPRIYDFLRRGRFDYWRIYEFNPEIVVDRFHDDARCREIEMLRGAESLEREELSYADGGVNCLFANFLLAEEQIARYNDKRIQFVGVADYDKPPYFFLDMNGEVYFSDWFSQGQRKSLGNILDEGFEVVRDKVMQAYAEGVLFDEPSFVDTENSKPLWARAAYEGNYDWEELERIDSKYGERFIHLSQLYLNRLKRQGQAPREIKLFELLAC